MAIAYIGIGSNLDKPLEQVKQALNVLNSLEQTKLVQASSLYGSKPMGPKDQPDYVNAVAKINTSLAPIELLDALQKVELEFGRKRIKDNRWGARVLDLDILLIDDLVIETPRLTVPHYGMTAREFVILPLNEIAPNLVLHDGTTIKTLSNTIDPNGLTVLSGN